MSDDGPSGWLILLILLGGVLYVALYIHPAQRECDQRGGEPVTDRIGVVKCVQPVEAPR
jgi:hypothetical protein